MFHNEPRPSFLSTEGKTKQKKDTSKQHHSYPAPPAKTSPHRSLDHSSECHSVLRHSASPALPTLVVTLSSQTCSPPRSPSRSPRIPRPPDGVEGSASLAPVEEEEGVRCSIYLLRRRLGWVEMPSSRFQDMGMVVMVGEVIPQPTTPTTAMEVLGGVIIVIIITVRISCRRRQHIYTLLHRQAGSHLGGLAGVWG